MKNWIVTDRGEYLNLDHVVSISNLRSPSGYSIVALLTGGGSITIAKDLSIDALNQADSNLMHRLSAGFVTLSDA